MPINSALLQVSRIAEHSNPVAWNTRNGLALAGRFSYSIIVTILVVLLGTTSISAESRQTRVSLKNLSASFESLSERVSPAVVQVLTTAYAPSPEGSGIVSPRRAGGSGVVLDADGYIVTNAHVVDGAQRVQVRLGLLQDQAAEWHSILKPRGTLIPATVLGIDRETDLAILKVDYPGLVALELGDSDDLRQGELVLAFGSPFGLENSVSMGIVSSVARQLRPEDPMIYVQTDATINPGNSGGPLVDSNGRIVGINTSILSQSGGSEGLGFAAPSNIVRNVFAQIKKDGRVRRGHIGVETQTITPAIAEGLRLTLRSGVVLSDVLPGSPAERAGLKIGDVVLQLNGKSMENSRQFDVNVYRHAIGDAITLEAIRGSEKFRREVSVVERPDDPERFAQMVKPEVHVVAKLGILGLELDSKILAMIPPLRKPAGVLVAGRVAGLSSTDEGLRQGDLISSMNGQAVTSLAGLRAALDTLKQDDAVVLQVQRLGRLMFVAFNLE